MTQAADTTIVVSLDEGTDEPSDSVESGTSQEPASHPQTAASNSEIPPTTRPYLW
jgi:hypothetical protein